jgi:hypothetical protein
LKSLIKSLALNYNAFIILHQNICNKAKGIAMDLILKQRMLCLPKIGSLIIGVFRIKFPAENRSGSNESIEVFFGRPESVHSEAR